MKTILLLSVLFTLAMTGSANAARPVLTDPACAGAVTIDKLITIDVSKTDLDACPKGLRSPYLCAMHKAGFASRSLGYTMRHTLADLGDGTCGRINLQGTLVYDAHGNAISGSKLVDPSRKMPETGLRFGAWKSRVLYVSVGEAELAMCTAELASCRAAVSSKPAASATATCHACSKTECPACPKCPKGDKVAKHSPAACPECPTSPTAEELRTKVEAFNARIAKLDALEQKHAALQAQVPQLLPVTTKVAECKAAGHLYDPAGHQCIEFNVMRETTINAAVASAAAQLDRLRATLQRVRSCLGRYRFTSETDGWCDTSR